MATFFGFLSPSQIAPIVHELCHQGGLITVTSKGRKLHAISPENLDKAVLETYQLYLIPATVWAQKKPYESNFNFFEVIIVKVGVLVASPVSTLTSTEFHGKDIPGVGYFASRLRRTLRRQKHISFGLVGRNVKFGGEATYPKYFYSDEVERLRVGGTIWKQSFDGNVEFCPAG